MVNIDEPYRSGGIPVHELLRKMDRLLDEPDRHKFHPEATLKRKMPDNEAGYEIDYIKSIEHDFALAAGDILENLNLKHLAEKPSNKNRGSQ